jgi:hypothetical protein
MWKHYRAAIRQTLDAALSPDDAEALSASLKKIIRCLREP